MIKECGCCSRIYDSFYDYIDKADPLCNGSAFVNHYDEEEDCRKLVFYVPCKNAYYDKWFEFNYCPICGRKVNPNHVVYR